VWFSVVFGFFFFGYGKADWFWWLVVVVGTVLVFLEDGPGSSGVSWRDHLHSLAFTCIHLHSLAFTCISCVGGWLIFKRGIFSLISVSTFFSVVCGLHGGGWQAMRF
jgi:hypothetical protein